MPAISRRGVLTAAMGVTAAVAMPPMPPVSGALLPTVADGPDAKLLRLCAAHERLEARTYEIEQLCETTGEADRLIPPLVRLGWSYRRRIAQHQARTLAGLQAKARIVKRHSNADVWGEMDPDSDEAIAFSLARDLLRLHAV